MRVPGSRASLGQFALIVGVVFVGEALVMTLLEMVHVSGSWAILIDPILLALICAPVLHRVLVGPRAPADDRADGAGDADPAAPQDGQAPARTPHAAGRKVIRIR